MKSKTISTSPGLHKLSVWLLRFVLLLYFVNYYYANLVSWNPADKHFWLAVIFIICAIIIFFGGLTKCGLIIQIPAIIIIVAGVLYIVAFMVKHGTYHKGHFMGLLMALTITLFFFIKAGCCCCKKNTEEIPAA